MASIAETVAMQRPPPFVLSALALTAAVSALPEAAEFVPLGASSYRPGVVISGAGPAMEGFEGNWLPAYQGAESPVAVLAGLSRANVSSGAGAFLFDGPGGGRVGRRLRASFDDFTEQTVYFSVLVQLQSAGSPYRAFELHNGGFDDDGNRVLQIATGEEGTGPFPTSNFVVRVKDGGFVDSAGRIGPLVEVAGRRQEVAGFAATRIRLDVRTTLYGRVGQVPVIAMALATVALVLGGLLRSNRSHS